MIIATLDTAITDSIASLVALAANQHTGRLNSRRCKNSGVLLFRAVVASRLIYDILAPDSPGGPLSESLPNGSRWHGSVSGPMGPRVLVPGSMGPIGRASEGPIVRNPERRKLNVERPTFETPPRSFEDGRAGPMRCRTSQHSEREQEQNWNCRNAVWMRGCGWGGWGG